MLDVVCIGVGQAAQLRRVRRSFWVCQCVPDGLHLPPVFRRLRGRYNVRYGPIGFSRPRDALAADRAEARRQIVQGGSHAIEISGVVRALHPGQPFRLFVCRHGSKALCRQLPHPLHIRLRPIGDEGIDNRAHAPTPFVTT